MPRDPASARAPTVGAVGLGSIGAPIARSIARAGLDLTVFDIRQEVTAGFAEQGIEVARTVGELGGCDLVSVTVLDGDQVDQVVAELAETMAAGANVIVHSTVLPETIFAAATLLAERGVGLVDAQVSGGGWAAERGELVVMVGGEEKTIEACLPELEAIGTPHRVGDLGTGAVIKILNNLMQAAAWTSSCEALRIARSLGVSEEALRSVALAGSGHSWSLEHLPTIDADLRPKLDQSPPGSFAHVVSKDAWMGLLLARSAGLHLPFVAGLAESVPGAVEARLNELAEPS
jgi:3-hydroxyisobutyrate dehydrogenase